MRLIDTHAHLQYPYSKFEESKDGWVQPEAGRQDEIAAIVDRARVAGVEKILNVGTSLADSFMVSEISEHFDNVFAVLGVHPHSAADLASDDAKKQFEVLANDSHPVALGEIGLDYYKMQNTREEQVAAFEWQLSLAKSRGLPVCIHTRDAFPDTYDLLKKYGVKGLIHSYTGDAEWAAKFIDLGFLIAFNGIVTFKNSKVLQETATKTPLEKIVLETDSPFLSPDPERGEVNEPSKVRFVAAKIAELKNIDVEEVGEVTSSNAEYLFGI